MKRTSIEWSDYTWNPITGCRNCCPYCAARKFASRLTGNIRRNYISGNFNKSSDCFILEKRFHDPEIGYIPYPFGYEPTFHAYRFGEEGGPGQMKQGYNIYTGSMAECFGPWIPDAWLEQIFAECETYIQHNYLFLTKHPKRYEDGWKKGVLSTKENCWYGITITSGLVNKRILPRQQPMFLNFEPLQDVVRFEDDARPAADWFIIGGYRNARGNSQKPRREWIQPILEHAEHHGIPVFMNNNLRTVVGREYMRKEYPAALEEKRNEIKRQDKMTGVCVKCDERKMKQEMIAVLTRSVKGEAPRQTAFICRECFPEICTDWGIKLPELEVYK